MTSAYRTPRHYGNKKKRYWVLKIFTVYLVVAGIEGLIMQGFRLETAAMIPSFNQKERVFARPISVNHTDLFTTRSLTRGEVVLVYPPYVQPPTLWRRILGYTVRFVTLQRVNISNYRPVLRRIIALPGDRVRMEKGEYQLNTPSENRFRSEFIVSSSSYGIHSQPLPPGWLNTIPFSHAMPEVTVPYGKVFVGADNRSAALDSRHWGVLPLSAISHRVIFHWKFNINSIAFWNR